MRLDTMPVVLYGFTMTCVVVVHVLYLINLIKKVGVLSAIGLL